jgi:hypothetical protein
MKDPIVQVDLPFTRKPCCTFFGPPTNAKVEVVIENGVGADSTSADMITYSLRQYRLARVPMGLSQSLDVAVGNVGRAWFS